MKRFSQADIKNLLDEKAAHFNQAAFIENDPVLIPHRFTLKADIEIAGLFSAVLAWGQRKTIIRKGLELMAMMDNAPHAFVMHHSENDLKPLLNFKHRTFNATDTLYFVEFLSMLYRKHNSLEDLFALQEGEVTIEHALARFHDDFFSLPECPHRTRKHVPTPLRKSTCKRINMFLRWMVRSDNNGVDFGIWKTILPGSLICPLDLHVDRVARALKLIRRPATDWQAALELTDRLRVFDPDDPVKYDFALFGLGIVEKFGSA